MLSKSYNGYVRHAVALSIGILGAHTYNKEYHDLLMKLLSDSVFYVR